MADAEQNDTKQRKRVRDHARDWAGMAAFVTAVAAAVGGGSVIGGNEDKHERMSKSVFNATMQQLTLMQYRLAVVEQACGVAVPAGFHSGFGAAGGMPVPVRAPASAPTRAPAHADAGAEAMVEVDADGLDEPAPPAPVRRSSEPLRKAKLTFDAIQRVVEAGEVYEPEE
jgi:hypothetical protein